VLNGYNVNEVLDILDKMPQKEQNLIIDILKNRGEEKRRDEILKNALETLEEYKKSQTRKGNVAELLRDLDD
jgi:hypothetical protein